MFFKGGIVDESIRENRKVKAHIFQIGESLFYVRLGGCTFAEWFVPEPDEMVPLVGCKFYAF